MSARKLFLFLTFTYFMHASIESVEFYFESPQTNQNLEQEMRPTYLYKILSLEDWKNSEKTNSVKLSVDDHDFIHLSKKDQLDRIIEKYWNDIPEFVILKIETTELPGKLIYEANPGGSNKYYHLYEGSIPFKAVVQSKTIKR